MKDVISVNHQFAPFTDHMLIYLELKQYRKPSSSRGYWKFNNRLLEDAPFNDYVTHLAKTMFSKIDSSRSSATNEGELLDDDDAISLTSSDPAASALLGCAQEEQEMSEGEEVETEPSQSSCPAYDELLEVMERATARLDLPWKRAKMVAPRGRLDERYLSGHSPPARVSFPFLPDPQCGG